ncbi:class I SAM-dependent methyltransferase [Frigoriflavimonas asaccharolytica]|uniref:Cyclopropane fatty-acyl-phospholipid synthase-like methyltransferase n=1 Tax=Frigoriflavimonas asaccharolytica TaxID=2735899 RepID=A0A8J8G8Q0_9FLAO|nr:class I SAM-dependent methyltransferase [Frigoriflavimonas asaccharolytica]NRS91544.1 cyclopropane fatty-acyl-phospholipid synthase-like methyltransferase [Frigoriflavimonas asaccharolytica]
MTWFKNWFNTPYYHILYKDRDFAEAENFISLLVKDLDLKNGSKIIDLACGKGRHSLFLYKLGFDVLGLDLSEESINHNKILAEKYGASSKVSFEVHDMREPIFGKIITEKVDAVFNLFTSFGYFESLEDDEKVFQSVDGILKDSGFFVLDFLNETFVKNNLQEEHTIVKDNITFKISKRIENQHIIKDIRFTDNGQDFHFFEKVKLHTENEIEMISKKFNFERVKLFGDYQLNNFDNQISPRCITIFKRK